MSFPPIEDLIRLPDGTYWYGENRVIIENGRIDITDAAARARLISVGELYEIISCNLFKANIDDANERLDCARIISDVIENRLVERSA
jgi:hypothetical protein